MDVISEPRKLKNVDIQRERGRNVTLFSDANFQNVHIQPASGERSDQIVYFHILSIPLNCIKKKKTVKYNTFLRCSWGHFSYYIVSTPCRFDSTLNKSISTWRSELFPFLRDSPLSCFPQ